MKRDAGWPPRRLPTPGEIADAPELAILVALDEILDLMLRALVAAHPELADPEAPFWIPEPPRPTRKASDVVATAQRLQRHLRAYRSAIRLARDQRLETDPDIRF